MSDSTDKPKACDDVILQDLGDEALLYDARKENVHVLNRTARFVWDMCDGNNTIADIKKSMQEQYDTISVDELTADLTAILQEMQQKNLIIIV